MTLRTYDGVTHEVEHPETEYSSECYQGTVCGQRFRFWEYEGGLRGIIEPKGVVYSAPKMSANGVVDCMTCLVVAGLS